MAEIGLYTLVVSRQVLDEAERNIRAKLPRALPNFAEQMSYLNLEILPDPTLANPPSGKLSSKQKMHPF